MVYVFAEIFSGLEWPTHRMLGPGAIDSSAYTTDNWGYSMIFPKPGYFISWSSAYHYHNYWWLHHVYNKQLYIIVPLCYTIIIVVTIQFIIV